MSENNQEELAQLPSDIETAQASKTIRPRTRQLRKGSFTHWLSEFELGEVRIREYKSYEESFRDHRALFAHTRFPLAMRGMQFSGAVGVAVYHGLKVTHILRVERTR